MPREKCRDIYRTQSCPSCANLYHGISPSLRYFPLVPHQLHHPVKHPEHGRVVVYPGFKEFNRELVWSHCLRFAIDLKAPINSFSVGPTPRACVIGHWGSSSMMSSLSLSHFELRRVPKNRAHLPKTRPGSGSIILFITDVPRVNLPRVLYVQGLAPLVEPPMIALTQILLHNLDVSFKEPFVGIVTDPVNARISSPDSPHQLTVLGVSPLLRPGCSSRGRRHADLCFCLGVSPPSPSRRPGRSRRRNPFCCLQYGCRKGSPHIINTAAAWRKRPDVVSDHCRYFLAQIGVIRQSSPVDRRRSFCLRDRPVASEATEQFHMCCDDVVIRDR